jgi:2-methylcitrate dehydratase PrpD
MIMYTYRPAPAVTPIKPAYDKGNEAEAWAMTVDEDVGRTLIARAAAIRYSDIPRHVVETAQLQILDYCASAVAGVNADGIPALRELAANWGGKSEASVVGGSVKLPAPLAALVNAATGRALELDDVHEAALLHPTVATVPVALAVAQAEGGATGEAFLTAVIVAQELMCRLGLAPEYHVSGPLHRPRGMSYTYQVGVLGGAVAAGLMLGQDESRLLDSFGNAFTAIAGNQQAIQEGVLAIRVQQGVTAQTALQSAYFASAGITGPRDALEGKFGWLSYWHDGRYDRRVVAESLGTEWETLNVSIKPYPTCRITHNAIGATMAVLAEHSIRAEQIDRIVVHVNSLESWDEVVQPVEQKRSPRTSMEAQFSLQFACAIAAVKGWVTLADLDGAALADPDVLAMAQKVEPVLDDGEGESVGRVLPMPITVDLHAGGRLVGHATSEYPLGHPRNPLGWEDVVAKLSASARWAGSGVSPASVDSIVAAVSELPAMTDVSTLAETLELG